MENKVNVLGTEYDIMKGNSFLESKNLDGLCRVYDKEIIVRSKDSMLDPDDSYEAKARRYKEVLRHELIHAFLSESGLDDYSSDEKLVEWLAIQFPKMLQAFKECDCV